MTFPNKAIANLGAVQRGLEGIVEGFKDEVKKGNKRLRWYLRAIVFLLLILLFSVWAK